MKLLFIALVCCLAASFCTAAPGDWPAYRANGRLDGHVSVKGNITQPAIVWTYFFGLTEQQYVLSPPGAEGAFDPPWSAGWGMSPPAAEIGGQSAPLQNSTTTTFAEVSPAYAGLEKFEFESGFSKGQINGQWQSCVGRMFGWREGQWTQVWESAPIELLFQPLPIVGDFDQDGAQEVAVLPWNELLVLDALTGQVKTRCAFTEGRSYGALYAEDLDGDGKTEFVVISDFAKHVDVLGYREGVLQLLWRRVVELDLVHSTKQLRAHPHAVAQVTGDAAKEVVVSLFNDDGEGRWQVLVLDGLSGEVLATFNDELLQGVADADGDGLEDLLTASTQHVHLPAFSHLRVRSLAAEPKILWEREQAGWAITQVPVPLQVNTAATKGRDDVLLRKDEGQVWAVVREPGPRLSVLGMSAAEIRVASSVEGPLLQSIALDTHGNLHFRSCTAGGDTAGLQTEGTLTPAGSSPLGTNGTSVPVVLREKEGPATIVLQGPAEQVVFLQAQPEGPPVEIAREAGRGQAADWPASLGVIGAELKGEGGPQVVYATEAPEGHARVVASDLVGKALWQHDFPDIPGTAPVWNTGGVILWQSGHFTSAAHADVLVQVRRGIMHTEETALLSGLTGEELWRRKEQVSGRGVGGQHFALADYDGDGLDDAASFHPSIVYLLKGSTGADIVARDATWDEIPVKPVYWGMPTAGDFENNGDVSLFFYSSQGAMNAVLRKDTSLVWWAGLEGSSNGPPAFGKFQEDGKMQAITFGGADGLRCYDTATGELRWHVPMPSGGFCVGSASGDLDGDGRDEALFLFGSILYCLEVGEDGQGKIAWQLALPVTVGAPVIADVEGKGRASILLAGADAKLYCIR